MDRCWTRGLLIAVLTVGWLGCVGSSSGGGGSDADAGDGDGNAGDGDGDTGDGDGDTGDGDTGDGDGDSTTVVDAGPTCVPADAEVLGEYLLAMRPSSVRNYGDVTALEIQPNGSLVELWNRTGLDPAQILPIPQGGFFGVINQLQFSVSIYRINPIDGAVMATDSITVEDAQAFKVNVRAIHYDHAASTLTTYDTTMPGWWATTFDFSFGVLSSPSRMFTGTEGYLDPYEGYSLRNGSTVAYDSTEAFSYTIDAAGITIHERDANGDYVDPFLFPLDTMMYDSVNEAIHTMVLMRPAVTCD